MAEFSIDRFVDRYAERTSGMSASEVRALFAVASRPEVVSLAGGMPYVEALPAQGVLEVATEVVRDLGPTALQYGGGQGQLALRERAAMLIWRLKRVARMETEDVRHYQADVPEDWASSMRMAGLPIPDRKTKQQVEEMRRMLMARLLPGEETMEKILLYESRLNRYLLQTLYMIMVLKGFIKPKAGRFHGVAELGPPEASRRAGLLPGTSTRTEHSDQGEPEA